VNRARVAVLLVPVLLAGCSSSGPNPGAPPRPGPPAVAASPKPTVIAVEPMPSGGFSGPGAFSLDWTNVKFAPQPCPTGHPLASCYAGTAHAVLPVTGDVTLARSEIVGDAPGPAPSGCVTAESDGTLTSPTGAIVFHASGALCGRTATLTVTASAGSGSLAGFQLQGELINDSSSDTVTETWIGLLSAAQ
jgi:hypothetical protein